MQFPDSNKCLSCPRLQGTSQIFLVVSGHNHTVNINLSDTTRTSPGINLVPLLRGIAVGVVFKVVIFFCT